ncbi:FGGY family carbohydrate kinase [Flexithrix dorotheae]|uniref:FGGY family carbohydrate kinase n=1 Tax=Flexithrix dorotheae TaxID=70993 RepID=UPI00037C9D46|nr:glycerol kinase GlpK [Flexithrix dorotheae]
MTKSYILSIDQGTSGTKALLFDQDGILEVKATVALPSYYPKAGFVEQDPTEIYQNVLDAVKACLEEFEHKNPGEEAEILSCGISNQRETFVIWNKTGKPLYPAVVWQCKRSIGVCNRFSAEGLEKEINNRTGLKIDPYFSGTKLIWLNENVEPVKNAIASGEAFFGTVDTWLLFKLTQGKKFLTDFTNASRTLFFNIYDLKWDSFLLEKFGLEKVNLPEVRHSSGEFGTSGFEGLFAEPLPITGMIGDSHAAAFGEGCFTPGTAKATLGTGSSILWNTGNKPVKSEKGMVTTICWSTPGRIDYALEGVIVSCGATIEWLKNQLDLFAESEQTESMASSIPDNEGVYLIPAFSGLAAPHWQMEWKASIHGITFKTDQNHFVRAALESIAYQIKDVIVAMEAESNIKLRSLKTDGGITANQFLMQFLTDLLNTKVVNIGIADVSGLGAALIAGLGTGLWKDIDSLPQFKENLQEFNPSAEVNLIQQFYKGWQKVIAGNILAAKSR